MITIKKSKPDCEAIKGLRLGTHLVRLRARSDRDDQSIAETCLFFWRGGLHTWSIAVKTARLVTGWKSTMNIALCGWVIFGSNRGFARR